MVSEKMADMVVEEIKKQAGPVNVCINRVSKNNGLNLTGITIRGDKNMSPVVYIEPFVEDGLSIEAIAAAVIEICKENDSHEFDVDEMTSKEYILNNLSAKLLNTEKNKEKLENVPHREFMDLSLTYIVRVSIDGNGTGAFEVTNDLLKTAGITEEELFASAKKEVTNPGKVTYVPLIDMVTMMLPAFLRDEIVADVKKNGPSLTIVTNDTTVYGASVLAFPDAFKKVADSFNEDLFILPSSVHEVIVLPVAEAGKEELMEMVAEVNGTQVPLDDLLSDNIYRYTRSDNSVSIA